ncbi:MerR family transcriptional regulator [Nocardia puris]|uniref:MerR family transcriptional regulator n=1 Tax=Nocardia puris TaxID=208602 RepID=UPI00189329A4|nr:MerR family transcriptional regulator [Nocardia puris]MBF6213877.1 MerR family transcriptional regulator [Nocardia puris]MBF6368516.1 MerR family transcriptional regulator [Nocardia puris]MBF6463003.1 MerR family transcriptional regulator [Nocardia puris]
MTATVSIGEFARLTYLGVKTLRHYHEVGLLEPVSVDPVTGYRRYSTEQVGRGHLIRRLRALDMPIPEIAAVLAAPDTAARDAALRAHLTRMEDQLRRTADVVASLRSLLTPGPALEVSYRSVPAFRALAMAKSVARPEIGPWCGIAFSTLYTALGAAGVAPAGPGGATYSMEFFEYDEGEVVVFVPIPGDAEPYAPDGCAVTELPGLRFAVAEHHGDFEDFDRTYGALGSYVAEHDVALPEPVREIYLTSPRETGDTADYRTEVCWPVGRL